MPEILGEQIIAEQGSFKKVKRWYRGAHPQLGLLIPPWLGLSGDWETVVVVDVIKSLLSLAIYTNEHHAD